MQAREGDRITIHGRTAGRPDRGGTILEVRQGEQTMYRVAWDDGGESTFVPSGGVGVAAGDHANRRHREERLVCRVEVVITEDGDTCDATAALETRNGTLRGHGEAHRHPDDPEVPMIGEELAIARALKSLAEVLATEAAEAVSDHESRPIHLITP